MKKFKYRLIGAFAALTKRMKPKPTFISAVVLAAGNGTRMGTDVTKQWLTLEGEPIFAHSLKAFQSCKKVKEIILCVKADELNDYEGVAKKHGITKLKTVICGGKSRSESAFIGFKKISDKCTHIAIHDAARCLVTPQMINKVISSAITYGAAAAACKATDTIKVCNENDTVVNTPDRRYTWQVQTPQIFEAEIYRASAYFAIRDGISVTDDCSLAEHAGFPVKLIDCGKENIKITEPIDMYFADAILKKRKGGQLK